MANTVHYYPVNLHDSILKIVFTAFLPSDILRHIHEQSSLAEPLYHKLVYEITKPSISGPMEPISLKRYNALVAFFSQYCPL